MAKIRFHFLKLLGQLMAITIASEITLKKLLQEVVLSVSRGSDGANVMVYKYKQIL